LASTCTDLNHLDSFGIQFSVIDRSDLFMYLLLEAFLTSEQSERNGDQEQASHKRKL
jgi:hypothetical protein